MAFALAALMTLAPAVLLGSLDAPNVITVKISAGALKRAREHYDTAIRPHLESGLIAELDRQPVPCTNLAHETHGNFFVMRAGSSTDVSKMGTSDLSWISVDNMDTWHTFRSIFEETGVAEAVAPLVATHERIRLYSSFYVVRSRCAEPNWHTDWGAGVGTNAWTLLTPLEDYGTDDFQLLYRNRAGEDCQYRYATGEAILFGSHFEHSTQPGFARGGAGAPHAFLCFTFGCDDLSFYEEHIAPTISGYQSRMLVAADGSVRLTQLGQYLEAGEQSTVQKEFVARWHEEKERADTGKKGSSKAAVG